MKNKLQKLWPILDILLLLAVTLYISYVAGMWNGYPIGSDAYAHLSKVKYMFNNWPDIDWIHTWANGMPLFLWYSIVPYLFLCVGKLIFGSYELSMQIITILAMFLISYSAYAIVRYSTKSRISGLLSGLLLLTLPALWGRVAMGEIPRFIATAFMPLAWLVTIKYIFTPNPTKKQYFLTVILIALALAGHYIVTVLTVISILIISYFAVGFSRKLWDLIKDLYLPSVVLAAFTLIPFFVSTGIQQVFGEGLFGGSSFHTPLKLIDFFNSKINLTDRLAWIYGQYGAYLHWLLIPLAVVLLVAAVSRREKLDQAWNEWKIVKGFFYVNLAFALYGLAMYFGFPGNLYNASLPPTDTFYLLSLSMPIFIGLSFHYSFIHQKTRSIIFAVLLVAIAYLTNLIYPWHVSEIKTNTDYQWFDVENVTHNELPQMLAGDESNQNYRFANNDSHIAVWFNYDYPNIPQTRDYYSQALLNQNEKFWFENSVFAVDDNYTETRYLLDWMAVKWLSVQFPNFNYDKFSSRPDIFKPVADNGSPIKEERIEAYEVLNPRPIIEATNAKTILVIGDESSYNNLLLSLSQTNLTSDKIIPVKGNQFIDLYLLDDLQQYDAVLLYNFSYIEKERAFTLLDQYVYQGGNLLVESSSILSKPEGVIAFLPNPVTKILPGEFGLEWQWQAGADQSILQDVNLSDFGPAIYSQDKPWGVLYSEESDLRENAQAILKNHDKVVIASMNHGEGRVTWSGLNLFYHFNNYKNEGEKRLVENLIVDLTKLDEGNVANQPGKIISSQQREIEINSQDYSGILIKENYFPNWSAYYIKDGSKKALEIKKAGLNMMYIPLPDGIEPGYTVHVEYHKSWWEWALIVLSAGYLVWLIITHLIIPEEKHTDIFNKKTKINKNKTKKWNPKHQKYQAKKEK